MHERAAVIEPLDTTAEVETPEHVRFQYRVAGPARRALAYVIDGAVRAAIFAVLLFIAALGGFAAGEAISHASAGVILLVLFALEWGYYVFFETLWSGRTPGKRALRLRVITEGGHPLRFTDSLLRNLLRSADFLPVAFGVSWLPTYAVGIVVMARDKRFRRLGDLVAGTIVIVEERQTVAGPLRLDPPASPAELRALPHRLPIPGDDLDAVELLLRRTGKLSAARETELADMIAPVLARRMGVRYRDPVRFLGLIHERAREKKPG